MSALDVNLLRRFAQVAWLIKPGTLVSRKLADMLNDGGSISAESFPIVGDGIADDTIPIQNALNGLCAALGKPLRFKRGTFCKVTARLVCAAGSGLVMPSGGLKVYAADFNLTAVSATAAKGSVVVLSDNGLFEGEIVSDFKTVSGQTCYAVMARGVGAERLKPGRIRIKASNWNAGSIVKLDTVDNWDVDAYIYDCLLNSGVFSQGSGVEIDSGRGPSLLYSRHIKIKCNVQKWPCTTAFAQAFGVQTDAVNDAGATGTTTEIIADQVGEVLDTFGHDGRHDITASNVYNNVVKIIHGATGNYVVARVKGSGYSAAFIGGSQFPDKPTKNNYVHIVSEGHGSVQNQAGANDPNIPRQALQIEDADPSTGGGVAGKCLNNTIEGVVTGIDPTALYASVVRFLTDGSNNKISYVWDGSGPTPSVGGAYTKSATFTADPATDKLRVPQGFYGATQTGDAVTVSVVGGALPTGLAAATAYYAIRDTYTLTSGQFFAYLRLATSLANANAGTAIDLSTAGSGTMTVALTAAKVRTPGIVRERIAGGTERIWGLNDAGAVMLMSADKSPNLPTDDAAYDIGASQKRFRKAYVDEVASRRVAASDFFSVGALTVAQLNALGGIPRGAMGFATDGRAHDASNVLEAAGAGTGVNVWFSGTGWRVVGRNFNVSA